MARYTSGGGGKLRTFLLYDTTITGTPPNTTTTSTIKSAITASQLSLHSNLDSVVLETTSPNFSGNSLTFGTNRGDVKSKMFFKDNSAPASEGAEEIKSENDKVTPVTISAGGGDLSKKCLVVWEANEKIDDGEGGSKQEIVAAVGYWTQESRNWGGTAGGTMNKFTWTFTAELISTAEYDLITKTTGNTYTGEAGYDAGEANWIPANTFTIWDRKQTIQQIFI